jgi:GTP-binding protein EngB required for normal cell division/uncharacterized protein (DUF697 family)
MKLDRFIRIALGTLVLLVFIVATGAIIFLTESALNVWDRLLAGPPVLRYTYVGLMVGLAIAAVWLTARLVVRRKPRPGGGPVTEELSQEEIKERLLQAETAGVDTELARQELTELAARRERGAVHLCFFGEVSAGKSSLIRALIPGADVTIDVIGGSTTEIRHYQWRADDGGTVLLTDVPGTGGHAEGFDDMALQEARRSHVVLFVCDGDLTRAESLAVEYLIRLDKPFVLVMNKSDRFSIDEQAEIMERLLAHLERMGADVDRDQVVAVTAGGETEVIQRDASGDEQLVQRERSADVGVLVVAIEQLLERGAEKLHDRRDRAVFRLAADRLAEAERQYRAQRSEQIIRNSTRKAVIGSLAAVSPGTDVLIQGYIGTAMTRELCKLYGAAPRDLDIEEFLDLSQSRVGRVLPLSLAVAGNGLKAFPGVGTVAGGLVHAVAYGLIFDALGRSLVLTLARHGQLLPDVAAREFEEGMDEHIEAGVRRVAGLALEEGHKES